MTGASTVAGLREGWVENGRADWTDWQTVLRLILCGLFIPQIIGVYGIKEGSLGTSLPDDLWLALLPEYLKLGGCECLSLPEEGNVAPIHAPGCNGKKRSMEKEDVLIAHVHDLLGGHEGDWLF